LRTNIQSTHQSQTPSRETGSEVRYFGVLRAHNLILSRSSDQRQWRSHQGRGQGACRRPARTLLSVDPLRLACPRDASPRGCGRRRRCCCGSSCLPPGARYQAGSEEWPKAVGQEDRHGTMQGRAGGERVHSRPPVALGSMRGPGIRRTTKPGRSGRNLTRKSQAISSAPSAKTTSPGKRIHCQRRVVS
jgi:hypothetical protein